MPNDDRARGARTSRAQVIHFPKREHPATRTLDETMRGHDRATTLTIPEFRPEHPPDDLVTEPNYLAADKLADAARATPPWPHRTRPAERKKSPAAKGKAEKKKKRASPRRKSTPAAGAAAPRKAEGPRPGRDEASPQRIAELSLKGHQLFEQGKLEDARELFERLVGQEPRDPFPYTMLGTIYLAKDSPDRALALFEAALEIDPDELAALVYRGEIRLNQGKLKPAMADLNRALGLGLGDDPFVDRARRLIRMLQDRPQR